jgi:hypothetical protein
VEANDSGHMKLIAEHYGMEKNGEGYLYKDVAFESLNSKNKTEFECIVYDLGVLDDRNKVGFENCNIRILCAGNKPQEILYSKNLRKYLIELNSFEVIYFSTNFECLSCRSEIITRVKKIFENSRQQDIVK